MRVFLFVLFIAVGFFAKTSAITIVENFFLASGGLPRCECDQVVCLGASGVNCVPLEDFKTCIVGISHCADCSKCRTVGGTFCGLQNTKVSRGLDYRFGTCVFRPSDPDPCGTIAASVEILTGIDPALDVFIPTVGPGVNYTHGCCPEPCEKKCFGH